MSRTPGVDPAGARDAARSILGRREFRPEREPKPLEGPLRWVSDRLNGVADWIGQAISDTFRWIFDLVPGLAGTILGIAICVGLAAVVVALIVRNRGTRQGARPGGQPSASVPDDPDALDRAADTATAAGEYATAIRLRYRAGLVRLDRLAVIDLRPWNTSATLMRRIGSARFDDLTGTFEAVAYGGRIPTNADASSARTEWPNLLAEVRSP